MKKILVLLVCLAMMLTTVAAVAETASGLPALTKDNMVIGVVMNS